jgi:plastocyanin
MLFAFVFFLGLLTHTSIGQTIDSEIYNHIALAQEQSPPLTNSTLVDQIGTSILGPPTNKTIYLFNWENEEVKEPKLQIPPDMFFPSTMAVNRGDTINIKFYNLEEPNGDRHSFTIGAPYGIDKDLAPGQNGTVTFKASESGVFVFFCKYHQPTMRGELIVLP